MPSTEIDSLLKENQRREKEMFTGYNPITGDYCYGERKPLNIPDFIYPKQKVPVAAFNNPLVKLIKRYKTIKGFITNHLQEELTEEVIMLVTQMLIIARAKCDPEFALYVFFMIQPKKGGDYIHFRLNYPQRLVIARLEEMRLSGQPIRLVILKARQWGGSTLVQLYMAWIQLFITESWYSAILAQTKDTSRRIKAMYTKVLAELPSWAIDIPDEKLQFSPYESSSSDSIITYGQGKIARNNVVSIASYENYDALRGNAYAMVHYSEVAFWKDTEGKSPEEVISSVTGGILEEPLTMEVLESSARGAAGYFYEECQLAMQGKSSRQFLFIPFFFIEHDTKKVANKREFAEWLLKCRDMDTPPEGWADKGKYYWRMWTLGASFEHINWYRHKRLSYHDHANMATEAPIDAIEAFKNSGRSIFNPYSIDDLKQKYCRQPKFVGDIHGKAMRGKEAIVGVKFYPEEKTGPFKIWALPTTKNNHHNRYVVSVDIGGRSDASDYSVITVIDRLGMMVGVNEVPRVVARWRGHLRHDYLAWKACAVAKFYHNALLVFESNTYDMEKEKNTEGEHMEFILDEVGYNYDNMYIRNSASESFRPETPKKWGFQTNKVTKPKVIDNLIVYIDDQLYDEPDASMYDELPKYQYLDDGTMGNVKGRGNHDDIIMSTAIGLYISQYEMPLPSVRHQRDKDASLQTGRVFSEAAI